MGLFSRKANTEQIMRDEAKAADMCKENAAKAAATGEPIYGISEAGWKARAENFQAEANRLKNQLDGKRR